MREERIIDFLKHYEERKLMNGKLKIGLSEDDMKYAQDMKL